MKINLTQLSFMVLMFLVSIWYCFLMVSCSPNYHMRKFIKKGGVIKQDTTIVTLSDTIKINGKDSIIYRSFSIPCPEMEAPKTRYETRIEYKRFRDTLKLIEYKIKYKYKTARTEAKTTKKRGFWYNLRFIGVIAGLLFLIILFFRWNK